MLNKAERYRFLGVIRQRCKFGLLPAQVDLSTWELLPLAKGPKLWACHLWFFLYVPHVMYKTGSLAGAFFLQDTLLHELVIHAVLAESALVYTYWYSVLYIKYPGVFGGYVKMTLTGNLGVKDDQDREAWTCDRQKYTPQDLFVISLPYILVSSVSVIFVALMCYPSMKVTLYAALPKEYQTWMTFGILILEELRFLSIFMCVTIPVWPLQVMSFDLVNNRLQLLINSMERKARARRLEDV